MSFSIGAGRRRIAHYGNCSPGKQTITITQAGGGSRAGCVTPGDTRLGAAVGSDRITGATLVGPC